jgi:hypothetical protein
MDHCPAGRFLFRLCNCRNSLWRIPCARRAVKSDQIAGNFLPTARNSRTTVGLLHTLKSGRKHYSAAPGVTGFCAFAGNDRRELRRNQPRLPQTLDPSGRGSQRHSCLLTNRRGPHSSTSPRISALLKASRRAWLTSRSVTTKLVREFGLSARDSLSPSSGGEGARCGKWKGRILRSGDRN